ncbi:MAG: nucleoside triphosphate pyrophosphohydrolase family protein [Pseudomonadota bacterium]|uniref:nucleoside triphosphate pyrophosphohydrolase family protein n=1 Tax=Gallaecimonas pentaromativorans TaxID=584787 RepID=UPI0009FB1C80|nr:nucleoside triphosphate pyrophosphohydrolase family protein [Gallaecimonas pentaromativorans]MED5524579.1 nucleoside triphosphate pyrophosphohydrolase family protein [Pseudomonadota bacterium]
MIGLPNELEEHEADFHSNDKPITLHRFQRIAKTTDSISSSGLEVPILGLFGEVGSLVSVLKKKHRKDSLDYKFYDPAISEELGDVIWYISCICSRAEIQLSAVGWSASGNINSWDRLHENKKEVLFTSIQRDVVSYSDKFHSIEEVIISIAGRVGKLLNEYRVDGFDHNSASLASHLIDILRDVASASIKSGLSLDLAVRDNIKKILSRWPIKKSFHVLNDSGFGENERFPGRLKFNINEIAIGGKYYVIQKCNGIIIGDRLTDNKVEKDDYRFHDVFHFSFAVNLGWSPVLRALLHLKRKSNPSVDENEDGARAILIEEGIASFIFNRGVKRDLYRNSSSVDYDLLKYIQDFVRGYEVDKCYLWQWEKAILDAFHVFRLLKEHRSGTVIVDFNAHCLTFIAPGDNCECA